MFLHVTSYLLNIFYRVLGAFGIARIEHFQDCDCDSCINGEKKLIWHETSQGAESERPMFLILGNDKDKEISKMCMEYVSEASKEDLLTSVDYQGKQINLKFNWALAVDGLVLLTVTGLGGCYCYLCHCKQEDSMNPALVEQGFPITRNVQENLARYEDLEKTVSGEIKRRNKDYERRAGMTQEPMEIGGANPFQKFPEFHFKHHVLEFFKKVYYYMNGRQFMPDNRYPKKGGRGRGNKTDDLDATAFQNAEEEFNYLCLNHLKIRMNQPDPSGNGGSCEGMYIRNPNLKVEN